VTRAVLTDVISGAPLAGKTADFALGTQSGSATTDGAGTAQTTIVINQPAGATTVSATFTEDALYLGSTTSTPFTITQEDLTFVYTGDTLTSNSVTPTLTSQATQAADGFPGDLSLAEATFSLAPALTTTPFDYTTGVDAAGASSTSATGLPVDLWTITVAVPSTNQYWQGASVAPAELVVFDPNGKLNGGPQGLDSGGHRTRLNVVGDYKGDTPRGKLTVDGSTPAFSSRDYAWIVVVGNPATAEINGDLSGAPGTARVRLLDAGEPARSDNYQVWLRNASNVVVYDSGPVSVDRGNLQVRIQ
jgi:hypothetical protein